MTVLCDDRLTIVDVDLLHRRYAASAEPDVETELLRRHSGLAARFAGRGEQTQDLEQVASVGLLLSLLRFDPGRGVRFSTFATVGSSAG